MRIALVSDYFYPAFGGVESHIIGLANILKRRGHEVIVITHQYETDKGTLGLRVKNAFGLRCTKIESTT